MTLPASMRFSANAGRIAAGVIFMNPYVRTAAAVATWLGAAGLVYDVASGLWTQPDKSAPQSTGYEYAYQYANPMVWYSSFEEACASVPGTPAPVVWTQGTNKYCSRAANQNPTIGIYSRVSSCPLGWYVTPAGCVQNAPPTTVTQDQFVDKITQNPMPDNVPAEVPGRYPVELPQVEPTFIPTGNPQKNPSYDPNSAPSEKNQPYTQPGVRVEPAPLASAPWQVSLSPVDRPVADSTPNPNPVPDSPGKQVGDEKRPDDRDFCDKHPKALACQEMEPPEDPGALPTKEVDMQLTPETGFSGVAVCPPPLRLVVSDMNFEFSWQPFCDSLGMLKNLLLAFAWLSAAFILLGAKRE